ncbi:PAS domain S-box protein [Pirellulaceae bacterium SH501]
MESANRATEGLFQYQCTDLIGKNIASLMPFLGTVDLDTVDLGTEDQNQEASKTIADRLVGILGDHREVQACRKDGTTFPVDLVSSRVDHLSLYTGIMRDITRRKQLQASAKNSTMEHSRS